MDEVEVDQCNIFFKSLEIVINLDVNISELKDSPYLSSNQLNQAKGALFILGHIIINHT